MSTIIISCGFLRHHLDAAQEKMNTNYDVIEMDIELHAEPEDMRSALWEKMESLPEEVDTVLIAMGLCGGSVSDWPLPRNIVMPKVDDCITLLMHTDDTWHANLKKCGHLYLADDIDGKLSVPKIKSDLIEKYGERKGPRIFDMWFKDYKSVDVIDTGYYDCHCEDYTCKAQASADLIKCQLNYVTGSNILLEKLVSGNWGNQFIKANKGEILYKEQFNKGE